MGIATNAKKYAAIDTYVAPPQGAKGGILQFNMSLGQIEGYRQFNNNLRHKAFVFVVEKCQVSRNRTHDVKVEPDPCGAAKRNPTWKCWTTLQAL